MKSKEIFTLAVRIIGLLFLWQGLTSVPAAINSLFPNFPHIYWKNLFPSLVIVGWPLLVAWWLVRGAPWLMRLAYPGEPANSQPAPQTPPRQ